MDIIKSNIVEYLTDELLKEEVDLLGLPVILSNIVDKSKAESYIESKLDDERITDLINNSLENNFTKFDFEKTDDFYLWFKKE